MGNLDELLEFWYEGKSAQSLLGDIKDPEASGIGGALLAFLINALKQQKVLPEDFHIYWIQWGGDFNLNDYRIFKTEQEALEFARKGPFEEADSWMLFQPYQIVNEESVHR